MKNNTKKLDMLVVGAGFAGMYLIYKFRNRKFNVLAIEAGDNVGGTWYWNRYPGAKCDVPSVEYSYSFSKEIQDEWNWTEKYASQPEILEYAKFVADRLDLKKNIIFNTKVTDAIYNEDAGVWNVSTNDGNSYECKYFVLATGCLSVPRTPNFKGMEDFEGEIYHTGNWPHTPVDFTGKNVAIIGTGSSGIQSIPEIAKTAKSLTVYIKDSNYTLPSNNTTITKEYIDEVRADYDNIRHQQRYSVGGQVFSGDATDNYNKNFSHNITKPLGEYNKEELYALLDEKYLSAGLGLIFSFPDLGFNEKSDEVLREYLDNRIKRIINDPQKANILVPNSGRYYDRRPVMDTNYYETYNNDNVHIVDVNNDPINTFTKAGIKTANNDFGYDVIVCATGFDAMTGAISRINIVGKNNLPLNDKWNEGPKAYLGLMSNGYPNMFMITGPGSPSVLSNMIVSIEQHVEWVDNIIAHMEQNNFNVIEAEADAEEQWVNQNIEMAKPLFVTQGNSWYVGANVPGKPRVIMPYVGGVGNYRKICEEITANGYTGFNIVHIDNKVLI